MTTLEPTSIDRPAPVCPHLRWNYTAHLLDGGLFIGAMAMLDASTVLPKMIESLGGPTWLIAAMPVVMMTGFLLPPIFTAHWIERLKRYKPLLLLSGVLQRLPYLLAALALFYLGPTRPGLAVAAVFIAPLISGIVGGSTLVAWQQLLVKTIPANRRSSMFASRNIMAAILGLASAWVVKTVIDRYPGAEGYGYLHLFAFIGLVLSFFSFINIRETGEHAPLPEEHHGLIDNLKLVPAIVKNDRNLRYFLLSNVCARGIFVAVPFLTIHILEVLKKPESYMGNILVCQMAGMVCGNIASGYIGDRAGNRRMLLVGRVSLGLGLTLIVLATNQWQFATSLFIFWFGFGIDHVSRMGYGLEICPKEKQATYLAIMAIVGFPAMIGSAVLSTLLKEFDASFTVLALVGIICMTIAVLAIKPLEEPRKWNYIRSN